MICNALFLIVCWLVIFISGVTLVGFGICLIVKRIDIINLVFGPFFICAGLFSAYLAIMGITNKLP